MDVGDRASSSWLEVELGRENFEFVRLRNDSVTITRQRHVRTPHPIPRVHPYVVSLALAYSAYSANVSHAQWIHAIPMHGV